MSLNSILDRPDHDILHWTVADKTSAANPNSTLLGAPLETSEDLYLDLQQIYLQSTT